MEILLNLFLVGLGIVLLVVLTLLCLLIWELIKNIKS